MRRRRRSSGASLDSLLDTMTNVVGILVILLAVTQLGVGDAVKRIRGAVLDVTPEELEEAREQVAEIEATVERLSPSAQDATAQQRKATVDLRELKQTRDKLRAELQGLSKNNQSPAQLSASIQELKQRIKDLEIEILKQTSERDRLVKQLKETPLPKEAPPEPIIVRLPNPRSPQQGSKPERFICRHGRIAPYDDRRLKMEALEAIGKTKFARESRDRIDCEKLSNLFETKTIGNGYFRLGIYERDKHLWLEANLREDAGEQAAAISHSRSLYQQRLRRMDKKEQHIIFIVWDDSYDVYLAARDVAEKIGFSCGWQERATDAAQRFPLTNRLGERVFCKGYEPPPEQPKPKPDPNKPAPKEDPRLKNRKQPARDILD